MRDIRVVGGVVDDETAAESIRIRLGAGLDHPKQVIVADPVPHCAEAHRGVQLARTGDRFIVEMRSNTLRPANTYNAKRSDDGKTWSGPNLMGRLLMELRDKGRLEYSLPDDVMRFPDLR